MLSVGQRARLLAAIPTSLGDYTVNKLRKDRFKNPVGYPNMKISILSQGIKTGPTTRGYIKKTYTGEQGDAEAWFGVFYKATVSISLETSSQVHGSADTDSLEELDEIAYYLAEEIEINRLGFIWHDDYMKVLSGTTKVIPQQPFFDEYENRWINSCTFDFAIEYRFSAIDPTPNIHALEYDFSAGTVEDSVYTDHAAYTHPPYYGMDVVIKGWRVPLSMDLTLMSLRKNSSLYVSTIIVSD
jgi:hypothetical protein